MQDQRRDVFAEIAAERQQIVNAGLVVPQPPKLTKRFLPAMKAGTGAAFRPAARMETAEQLAAELQRCRQSHQKYLADLAPAQESSRQTIQLTQFDWRVQTPADQRDFSLVLGGRGVWEKVSVPHYGPPLGKAVTYYRTTFSVTQEMLAKGAVFVCFKGVDYKAHVFLNGSLLGSHEGFFAPFEFDFTAQAKEGENALVVIVENDSVCMGNEPWPGQPNATEGDKLYAATGLGYDDPQHGWHHCPPAMGMYQDVFVEARPRLYIRDIFVRPILDEKRAEAWVEVGNCDVAAKPCRIELSVFGQNFQQTLFSEQVHKVLDAGPGPNSYRISFDVSKPRLWSPQKPWLYQLQARLVNEEGSVVDSGRRQFGMRSFRIDEEATPKGRIFLNGTQVRLRGANDMGATSNSIMKKDWQQVIDDILLAKISNMNFIRVTQRPVQPELYDYCDRLGLMTQTDLPLFAVLRRSQFCEAIRQASEMELLVRSHPCNIMVTYINEPFRNGRGKPHRNLVRKELEAFFESADRAVRLANPDRVIKPVDGDYDPPAYGLPDNHCYTGWYCGHEVDLGKLHKGYWQRVKPGWLYACGEFGSEALDRLEIIRERYPKNWLPENEAAEKTWTPDAIPKAQMGRFHYFWFDTQTSVRDWVEAGQDHQAWVTRLMTEAFRRDNRMVSFAIHYNIDAWPAGWMKALMDVTRYPKKAFFTYRDALQPLIANLRGDRWAFYGGEEMVFDAWVCNDLSDALKGLSLQYQLEQNGKVLQSGRSKADVAALEARVQGYLKFKAPQVETPTWFTLRLGLIARGKVLSDSEVKVKVFPKNGVRPHFSGRAFIVGAKTGKASMLARDLGLRAAFAGRMRPDDHILIDDFAAFARKSVAIMAAVEAGARAMFLELPAGKYDVAGSEVNVEKLTLNPRHFVSRKTGHPFVADFEPNDFRFWFDKAAGYVTPILETCFTAEGFTPILGSGNGPWAKAWHPAIALGEKLHGKGIIRVAQVKLAGRLTGNPAADILTRRLFTPTSDESR
jgi:hypothetical protein